MSLKDFIKNPKTALVGSSFAIFSGVGASLLASTDPISASLIVASAISAISAAGADFFPNACEKMFLNKSSREEILTNGDLTRAVGRAIFAVILKESQSEIYGEDCERLKTIGNSDESIWENIVLGIEDKENPRYVLTDEDLKDLSSDFLTQYFAAEKDEINQIDSLTPHEWRKIVEKLAEQKDLILQLDSSWNLAKVLHKQFAKSLRKTLITDFKEDGRAFASLQLRILSEILSFVKENNRTNKEILKKVDLLGERTEKIQKLLTVPTFSADETFWQKAFDLQTNILENTKELLSRSDKAQTSLDRILEILENQPEQKTLPKRISHEAFPKLTDYFTGRDDVIRGIRKTLEKTNKAALHGISGLGKTTVALEYAKRFEDEYQHIIFLRALENTTEANFASLAEIVDETAENIKEQKQKANVFKRWLEENEGWLLLIDNVEKTSEVTKLLPNNPKGHILSTGNSNQITVLGNEVTIEPMKEENGELLLYRRAKTLSNLSDDKIKEALENEGETEQEALKSIVEELDGLPLALNLAGAYIHKYRKSFERYKNLYETSAHKLLEKQDENSDYQNDSVALAFSLAYETISTPSNQSSEAKQIAETAILFLKTATFLAPDAMPLEIFTEVLKRNVENGDELAEDEMFLDEVFAKIAEFDLFEKDVSEQTFDIHRLVQLVVSNKIEAEEKSELCNLILDILTKHFPEYDYNNKETCERFYNQTQTTLENAEELSIESEKMPSLYYRLARYQKLLGNFSLAEMFYQKDLEITEKIEGNQHPNYAARLNNLAIVYKSQGNYDEAIKLYKQALEIDEKTIGIEHPDYATHLNNLANVYESQGNYDEAIKLYKQALEIGEKTIGIEHPDYATHLNNLALVYESQGNYDEAIKLYKQALDIDEKTIGIEHPDYAIDLNNLANVYESQGNYDEAIKLYKQALEIGEKTIGIEHPNYAIRLSNLAIVYENRGKYNKALELYEQALKIDEAKLPENHPYTKQDRESVERCRRLLEGK